MKRLVCASSTLAFLAFMVVASRETTPSIKQLMKELHFGSRSHLATLRSALIVTPPDWAVVQAHTKDVVTLGAALAKNEPPRGDKAEFAIHARTYYEFAKELDTAARKYQRLDSINALNKLGNSCKSCHAAHKGE